MSENENKIIDKDIEAAENDTVADAISEELIESEEEAEAQKALSKEAELAALHGFNWKKFWDKVTTGLLILLMASPFLILVYILLWFIMK